MTYQNYSLKQLQQIDAAHHLHPFTDHKDLRDAGTRMLVSERAIAGTVGGGHLEFEAIERARQHVREAGGALSAFEWPVALGPTLGQCCGGALTLRFTPLTAEVVAAWPQPQPRLASGTNLRGVAPV